MHGYLERNAALELTRAVRRSPVTAILGPRQCGKSTLARHWLLGRDAVYLDLQDRADRAKLNEPELFFEAHRDQLVCMDEIQLTPDLFSNLRSEVDRDRRPGRFLMLGSASRDLIRQSRESLAGRIAYLALTPFMLSEVEQRTDWRTLWLRGGFPNSLLAADDRDSFDWRVDFIRTFLERDIPALGLNIPIPIIDRLWRLLAHYHGQTMNYSKLAGAIDLSVPTLKKYLAVLEQTYMVRLLPPWESNLKKRMVRSPKLYVRDAGILHGLLDIEDYDQLLGNPAVGGSWEGFAIEQLISGMDGWRPAFVRTGNGAEIDLILERGERRRVFEIKLSKAPKPSRGFFELVKDIEPNGIWLIAPVDEPFDWSREVRVSNLTDTSWRKFGR